MITTEQGPVIASPPPPTPPLPPIPASEPPFSLGKIIAGLGLVVAAFDFCFWGVGGMGFSVAVFVPVLVALILANREGPWRRRTTLTLCALLAGACLAAMIETGVTNALSLVILIITLAGDSYFDGTSEAWSRWFCQLVALAFAPGRIFWLAARVLRTTFGRGAGRAAHVLGGFLLAVPALVLALVFGSLLASGNAVFGKWTEAFFDWFWKELASMFDVYRITVWLVVGFLALPLLRPAWISAWWWSWIPRFPRWPELVPARGAAFSSALILIVLNILFAVANVADAVFLWGGTKLPAGVTYSGYVHSGVNTLTITVILSAVLLAGLFQQQLNVAGQRWLKVLGLIWIAQNLFVLVSVVLRLKLYIEAYDMTVARLSVIIFLMLVAAGYGLLAIKIVREKSLPWLVGGCAVAIFATFYITQFLNLSGWTAGYNVAQWEKDKTRNLDLVYLQNLGPAAWPAFTRGHEEGLLFSPEEWAGMQGEYAGRYALDAKHWREFSLRAYWNKGALEEKK